VAARTGCVSNAFVRIFEDLSRLRGFFCLAHQVARVVRVDEG
jgi:hypothetical protein